MTEPKCYHCGQIKAEHCHVNLRCFLGSEEYFEPCDDASDTPRTDPSILTDLIHTSMLSFPVNWNVKTNQ